MSAERSLDVAKSASVDIMALNNLVVSMRQVVKKAKVHVIRRLINQLKVLKKRQKASNKITVKEKEITIIKSLSADRVSKFSLGNTTSFKDICKRSDVSPEVKALARLTDNSLIQKTVTDFRVKHKDWQSLSMFLMSKQSGRRFHKRKNMKRKETITANRKTGEAMIENLVKIKFEGQNVEDVIGREVKNSLMSDKKTKFKKLGSNQPNTNNELTVDMDPSTASPTSRQTNAFDVQEKQNRKVEVEKAKQSIKTMSQVKSDVNVVKDKRKIDKDVDCIMTESGTSERDRSDSSDGECGSSIKHVSDSDSQCDIPFKIISNKDADVVDFSANAVGCETFDKSVKTQIVPEDNKMKSVAEVDSRVNKQHGDMVIKQLNLDDFDVDDEVTIFTDVFKTKNISVVKVKKLKDKFFIGDNIDEDYVSSGDEDSFHDAGIRNLGDLPKNNSEHNSNRTKSNTSSFVSLGESTNPSQTTNSPKRFTEMNRKEGFTTRQTFNRNINSQLSKTNVVYDDSEKDTIWNREKLKDSNDKSSMLSVKYEKIPQKGLYHPSWEASRKRRDKSQANFAGIKTKFTDSD